MSVYGNLIKELFYFHSNQLKFKFDFLFVYISKPYLRTDSNNLSSFTYTLPYYKYKTEA